MAKATFTPQQKKTLIVILVVLAALRFMGVPFLDYQAQQITRLELTSQQLERASRLLNSNIDDEKVQQLQTKLQEIENSYMVHTGTSEFRLIAQRQIQNMVGDYGVQIDLFDWLTQREVMANYLYTHQARIILQGNTENVVQAQLAMQEQIQGVKVLEFALQEQSGGYGRMPSAKLTLLLEASGINKGDVNKGTNRESSKPTQEVGAL